MKKKLLALLLSTVMVLGLAACGGTATPSPSPSGTAPAVSPTGEVTEIKVGGIMLHDENSGYDIAHIEGLTTACENLGLDIDTQLIIRYNIPEIGRAHV